jgi:hypothetical protein
LLLAQGNFTGQAFANFRFLAVLIQNDEVIGFGDRVVVGHDLASFFCSRFLDKAPFKFLVILNVTLNIFCIPNLQLPREVKVAFVFKVNM